MMFLVTVGLLAVFGRFHWAKIGRMWDLRWAPEGNTSTPEEYHNHMGFCDIQLLRTINYQFSKNRSRLNDPIIIMSK